MLIECLCKPRTSYSMYVSHVVITVLGSGYQGFYFVAKVVERNQIHDGQCDNKLTLISHSLPIWFIINMVNFLDSLFPEYQMLSGYLLLPVYLKERQDTIYVFDEEKVSNKVVYSMIHPELCFFIQIKFCCSPRFKCNNNFLWKLKLYSF